MSRDRYKEDRSESFSDWHRDLPDWYTWIDIDGVYYRNPEGSDVYLLMERITITKHDVDAQIHRKYPIDNHKKNVYLELSELANIEAVVVWHNEECTRFAVREIAADSEPELLCGYQEFADWIDEYRLA